MSLWYMEYGSHILDSNLVTSALNQVIKTFIPDTPDTPPHPERSPSPQHQKISVFDPDPLPRSTKPQHWNNFPEDNYNPADEHPMSRRYRYLLLLRRHRTQDCALPVSEDMKDVDWVVRPIAALDLYRLRLEGSLVWGYVGLGVEDVKDEGADWVERLIWSLDLCR